MDRGIYNELLRRWVIQAEIDRGDKPRPVDSANVQVNNGASMNLVGAYDLGAMTISPTPKTGQAAVKDPLAWLPSVPWSTWPTSGRRRCCAPPPA